MIEAIFKSLGIDGSAVVQSIEHAQNLMQSLAADIAEIKAALARLEGRQTESGNDNADMPGL